MPNLTVSAAATGLPSISSSVGLADEFTQLLALRRRIADRLFQIIEEIGATPTLDDVDGLLAAINGYEGPEAAGNVVSILGGRHG